MSQQAGNIVSTFKAESVPVFPGSTVATMEDGLVREPNGAGQLFLPVVAENKRKFKIEFGVVDGMRFNKDPGGSVVSLEYGSLGNTATGSVGVGGGYLQVTGYYWWDGTFIYISIYSPWAKFTDGTVDHGDSILVAMKEYDLHTVTVYPYGETSPVMGAFYTNSNWLEVFNDQGAEESAEQKNEPRESINWNGLVLYKVGGTGSSKRLMRVTKNAPKGQIPAVFVCEDGRKGLVNLQKI